MKLRKHKGQTIVEFALILPIFCLFLFGIFYAGMFVVDYVTLSHVAQNAARSAVVNGTPAGTYTDNTKMILDNWYSFGTDNGIAYNVSTSGDSKTVTITATRSTNSKLLKIILPESYTVHASMYSG